MALKLGTRGSQLALFQAHLVRDLLQQHAGAECTVVVIRTSGDRLSEAPLSEIGGKRLFVKEIEDALLNGEVDLAVHSSKDMSAVLPDGLSIGAALPREDPRDAIVLPGAPAPSPIEAVAAQLGRAPRIGTSSVRRIAQLRQIFPDAEFLPVRGNLDSRLRKLDDGGFDALVLAAAGLRRLQRADRISALVPAGICVPAPGQGIIAVEIRAGDDATSGLVATIDEAHARAALDAERAVVTSLGGGCQMPLGAYATVTPDGLELTAVVLSLDGARVVRVVERGPVAAAHHIGATAAAGLLAQGAAAILAGARGPQADVEGLQP